jgi:2-haloacid dehalogenase
MKPRAVVFDAYGTLFDVHTVVTHGRDIDGDIRALSVLWRQRQLEYTWLRSLMDRYEDFWSIREAALRSASRQLRIAIDDEGLDRLMKAYLFPTAFEDVKPVLKSLKAVPLVILSNGSLEMLESAVRHNGFESFFTELISVDRARIYKPSPRAYSLGTESLRLAASDILFVSSNSWDGSGAKAYGYTVCWCNRQNQEGEFLEGKLDLTVTRLDHIADLIG